MKKRRSGRLLMVLGLILVLVAGAVMYYQRWASRYREFLQLGSSIDAYYAVYSKDFQAMDQALLLSSYRGGAGVNFFARPDNAKEVDGVRTVSYLPLSEKVPAPALWQQMEQYFAPIASIEKAKFKLNRLHHYTPGKSADIRVRFQVWGRLKDGDGFYDSGRLAVKLGVDGEDFWIIASQEVIDMNRVLRPEHTFFTDVTAESGLTMPPASLKEFQKLVQDWRFSIITRLGRGAGVADVDGDADLDLLIAGFERATLWLNDGQGQFVKASGPWALSPDQTSCSLFPLFGDIDNDGDPDILLLRAFGESKVFRNDAGRFTDVTERCGLKINEHAMTASFADYDNDGDLDLYVGNYGNTRDQAPETVIRSTNGEPDQLFSNRGDGTFEEVTAPAGVKNTGWTLATGFFDIDADGDADIYAANDFGYNKLFINNGNGTFSDRSWEAGVHDIGSTMSVSFLDYDEDGDLDLYTSAIASNTIWFQGPGMFYILTRFLSTPSTFNQTLATVMDLGQHLDRKQLDQIGYKVSQGNSLMENLGDGTFRHREVEAGIYWAEWAWGTSAEDFDCDGDTDVYVANGFITGPKTDDF